MEKCHQLWICGTEEFISFKSGQFSHLITIANPGNDNQAPKWFDGMHLSLWFGDVISDQDAKQCRTKAVCSDDIRQAINFFRGARQVGSTRLLVACDYGASRSPAIAYILLADLYGPGREAEAFNTLLAIRPEAVPNSMVVKLGDILLDRKGALLIPLRVYFSQIESLL